MIALTLAMLAVAIAFLAGWLLGRRPVRYLRESIAFIREENERLRLGAWEGKQP